MKINNLPFSSTLKAPENIEDYKTSQLLENNFLVSFKNPGLAYFSPIGNIILDRVKSLTTEYHSSLGILKIKIPSYMKRELLEIGEEVSESFGKKFVMLPRPMDGYMILTTHEMEILDWLKRDNLSYRNLPLRLFFYKNILRPINDPKGILKSREFGVQIMTSLDRDLKSFKRSLDIYSEICEGILNDLNVPFFKLIKNTEERRASHLDFDLEYFYKCNEGEPLSLGFDSNKEKALSLAMGYRYVPKNNILLFTDKNNQQIPPIIGTYAMGLERLLYAAFDSSRDNKGFNLPFKIRPFDVSILTFDDFPETNEVGNKIYLALSKKGYSLFLDDRKRFKRIEKANFSDFIGIPKKITVSKSSIRFRRRTNPEKEIMLKGVEEVVNCISQENQEVKQ